MSVLLEQIADMEVFRWVLRLRGIEKLELSHKLIPSLNRESFAHEVRRTFIWRFGLRLNDC